MEWKKMQLEIEERDLVYRQIKKDEKTSARLLKTTLAKSIQEKLKG